MIIDRLENAGLYNFHEGINKAFEYLRSTDLIALPTGKHVIDGDKLFALMQEYDTVSTEGQQLEAHKKYIDVQYMIHGAELVGHVLLNGQTASKAYDAEGDYHLFAEKPTFYSKMDAGTFMIFFPGDLHMPSLQIDEPAKVKKVVVKVAV